MRRGWLVVGVVLVTALLAVGSSAASARALRWSQPIHVGHNGIAAMSCSSPKQCVAGSGDGLLVSTDPAGPAGSWQLVFVPPASTNAAPQVTSVSCPTTSFCAAVTLAGDLLTSTDPAGGPTAWQLTRLHMPVGQFPNINVPQVSCSSPSLCVAIAAGSKAVFSTSDPTGGAGKWKEAQLKHPLETVACTGKHLCVMGDNHGDVRTSNDPLGGARTWTSAHIFGAPGYVEVLHDVACGSPHWCLIAAINFSEDILVLATKPTVTTPRTRGAWQDVVAADPQGIGSGSCVGTFCAYAGYDGTVYYPTGSFRTLTHTRVYRSRGLPDQGSISCATRNWCAMGTSRTGNVYIGSR